MHVRVSPVSWTVESMACAQGDGFALNRTARCSKDTMQAATNDGELADSWPRKWETWQILVLATVSIGGLELVMNYIVPFVATKLFRVKADVPRKGKHLDHFDATAQAFVMFSKSMIVLFMYHMINFAWFSPQVLWGLDTVSVWNTILPLPVFFIMYDSVYHPWHRFMHWKPLYPYIHKHHHQQMVPTRGYLDGINVHPIEFVSGEYLHLGVLKVYGDYIGQIHVSAVVLFILIGGSIASLNHTRLNVIVKDWVGTIYHDIHHSVVPFEQNYSQYSMVWDKIYGTYLPKKSK